MKNTPGEINRLAGSKEWVSYLEYRVMKISQAEQQKEKKKWGQVKGSLGHQPDNHSLIGVPEGE